MNFNIYVFFIVIISCIHICEQTKKTTRIASPPPTEKCYAANKCKLSLNVDQVCATRNLTFYDSDNDTIIFYNDTRAFENRCDMLQVNCLNDTDYAVTDTKICDELYGSKDGDPIERDTQIKRIILNKCNMTKTKCIKNQTSYYLGFRSLFKENYQKMLDFLAKLNYQE